MIIEEYLKLSKDERISRIEQLYTRLVTSNDRDEIMNIAVTIAVFVDVIENVADLDDQLKKELLYEITNIITR
jgi:hypothetical protein